MIISIYLMHVGVCMTTNFLFFGCCLCRIIILLSSSKRYIHKRSFCNVFQLFNQLQIKRWRRQDMMWKHTERRGKHWGSKGAADGQRRGKIHSVFLSVSSVLTIVNQMTMIPVERRRVWTQVRDCVYAMLSLVLCVWKVQAHQPKIE